MPRAPMIEEQEYEKDISSIGIMSHEAEQTRGSVSFRNGQILGIA